MMIGIMTAAITSQNIELELDDTRQVSISENTSLYTYTTGYAEALPLYMYTKIETTSQKRLLGMSPVWILLCTITWNVSGD